jgi:HK97 family phage major capsid protein
LYPDDLSPEAEGILSELTSYHRTNLLNVQRDLQRKRDAADRKKNVSLARALRAMSEPNGLSNSPEGAFFETLARLSGGSYDAQRIIVPFRMLRRDLTVANADSAGYLVAGDTQAAVDILRPFSVAARMGLTVETGLVGNAAIPKVTAKTTPAWATEESTAVSPSQPTLAQVALAPKTVGIVVNISRQLTLQSNAELVVRRELLRTVGTAIDQAVINGSGASGQPLGLLNTVGVQTQSGTTLNAGVFTMKQKCASANADDEAITFLSAPAVRELLETRERATGGGRFVWQDGKVADRRAFVTTDLPASTMVAGDWTSVYFGLWGPGFVVEINPYDSAGFKTGTIRARIVVSCDVAVLHPSAFVVASSIT